MSMRTLKDLGKIVTGNTPKMSERENFDSADIPFIKPGDISDDSITVINKGQFFISENARDKARILPSDSILVTCIEISREDFSPFIGRCVPHVVIYNQ